MAVLRSINHFGSMSMADVAKHTGLPYPTASRLVRTLIYENLLEAEPNRKRYRPTALVKSLSHGYKDHSGVVAAARPYLESMTERFLWPVSLATRVGPMMTVRDSTHAISPMSLEDYYPGATFPLHDCASGQIYLSYVDEEERHRLIEAIESSYHKPDKLMLDHIRTGEPAAKIRADGYVIRGRNQFTTTPGRTSSIAVPVMHDGSVHAALVLICFASSMDMDKAVNEYVPALTETATQISKAYAKVMTSSDQ